MKILIVAKVEHCLLAFISVAAGFRMLIPAARPLFESIFASPLKPGSCLPPPLLCLGKHYKAYDQECTNAKIL